MSNTNDNDWETCYSDEEDYIETMGNLKIESSGVKMKGGKISKELNEQNNILNKRTIIDNIENIGDNHSVDDNSIANYSFDCSMISDINDFSFLTNGQNLAVLLNNSGCNTLQDEINDAIDREVSVNPDTSLIAKTFFNSNDDTDLSTILPQSIKGNNSLLSLEPNETKEAIASSPEKENISEQNILSSNNNITNNTHVVDNDNFNPMFINRISSFPIVQQSVQAIKNTSIGNLADRTIRRVASTRLPVINVPKLPNIPKIIGKKDNDEDKSEKSELNRSSITIEDATKNIPGLATIDNLGCKTLDKLEENFPMINDPELLDKILNRIEELREIGENSYVVQSSLNSLQNMQTRLNRYNSVIVKRKNNNNSNNNSTLKHRHSFSVATTKTASASTTYRDRNFFASSSFHTSTTARANASVETIDGCCCCCKCHHQHINNPIDVQKMVQQQQENLIKSTYQNTNDIHQSTERQQQQQQQQQSSKFNFFLKRGEKSYAIKEIINIRENLQSNINAIPNAMYGRINSILTAIEKKLLSGTNLEKEIAANIQENKENKERMTSTDLINNNNNNENYDFSKEINKFTAEPSSISSNSNNNGLQTTITTTMTTSTSTTSTVTTTINSSINSKNSHGISSPIPSTYRNDRHNRMTSSDYETDSTLYSPSLSVYSPRTSASSPLSEAVTPKFIPKTPMEIKSQDISPQTIHIINNTGGANVHDLYSFLEEVNKLLSIYLITRKKTDQNVAYN